MSRKDKKRKPASPRRAPAPRPDSSRAAARPVRHDLIRAVTLEVYAAVRLEGQLADRALDRVLRRERRLYSAERRAVAESVWDLLRRERRLDFDLFGGEAPRLDPLSLHALRYAALQVQEGADPAEAAARNGVAPALAARLHRVGSPLPGELSPAERVAIEGSLPGHVADLLIADYGLEEALSFVRAVGQRAPLTVRANLLKTDRAALAGRLRAEGVEAAETRYSPWALNLEARINAFALPSFQDGLFEVQDEGSQLLALCLGARPGQRVVDTCAGAGGKTLALAAEMRNSGELWALDVDASRLDEARRRARRAGVHNVRVRPIPADDSAAAELSFLAGKADRVLIDAPCTGLGALRRNPDARYRFKPEDFGRYATRQLELLRRFSALARPGGRVVYATCSVAREEDDRVVQRFLAEGAPFRVVPVAEALSGQVPGEALAELSREPCLRLLPQRHGTDGFFAAVLERAR